MSRKKDRKDNYGKISCEVCGIKKATYYMSIHKISNQKLDKCMELCNTCRLELNFKKLEVPSWRKY
jgi:hypothetical protein